MAAREAWFKTMISYSLLSLTGPRRGNLLEGGAARGVGSSLGHVGGAQRDCGHDQQENSPENENTFFGECRMMIRQDLTD